MPAAANDRAKRATDREEVIHDAEAVLADIDGAPDPEMIDDAFKHPACSTHQRGRFTQWIRRAHK